MTALVCHIAPFPCQQGVWGAIVWPGGKLEGADLSLLVFIRGAELLSSDTCTKVKFIFITQTRKSSRFEPLSLALNVVSVMGVILPIFSFNYAKKVLIINFQLYYSIFLLFH